VAELGVKVPAVWGKRFEIPLVKAHNNKKVKTKK
jgi:hypothetical protein